MARIKKSQSLVDEQETKEYTVPSETLSMRLLCWRWELLSLSISLACILATIALLSNYDGKEVPSWHGFTLNCVVSVLAVVPKAALILPVAEALSQLKWHWFWEQDQPRPVSDFDWYDNASRGPWGSFLLLLTRPCLWHASSLGAIITVAALALEPSLQQVPSFYPRLVSTIGEALIPYNVNCSASPESNGEGHNTLLNVSKSVRGAFYDVLYDSGSGTNKIVPICPTGNCTWPAYSSLGVCKFNDALNESYPAWELPGGIIFPEKDWGAVFSLNNLSIVNTFIALDLEGNRDNNVPPYAWECMLYYCVRPYSGRTSDGEFHEETSNSWPDPQTNISSAEAGTYSLISVPDSDYVEYNKNLTIMPPSSKIAYHVDERSLKSTRDWLRQMLTAQLNLNNEDESLTQVVIDVMATFYMMSVSRVTAQNATGTQITTRFGSLAGPGPIFDRLADSLTLLVRRQGGLLHLDHASSVRIYVECRWVFLVLPIVLLVVTVVFMAVTIAMSARRNVPTWKSAQLPVLVHGVQERFDSAIGSGVRPLSQMREAARDLKVAMTLDVPVPKLGETTTKQDIA
ncbi:hypothetical protein K431DRAFT_344753 [Polychaeton citri CBS 116435]|uniref:Uncharacterized protein n=1 Tax=Polychaeton citri CBS 116435 TaxID=1314669 RepID=A0A9P4QCT0_9PEZI|nr:hypothetical protein K431DRAFT_344753 [Polychaeton citri CBS 116435]